MSTSILIATGDAARLSTLADALSAPGDREIRRATDAKALQAALEERRFDAVVLDAALARESSGKLRLPGGLGDAAVVLLVSADEDAPVVEAIGAGAHEALAAGAPASALLRALQTAGLRARAEAGLRRGRVRLLALIDRVGDPIVVKDRQHRLVLANASAAALAGKRSDEMLGKTEYDFFPREQVDVFWRQDQLVLESGREDVHEELLTDAGGNERVIATKKTLLVDDAGEPFVVGVMRDITDRKLAESALRESEERYRQLVDTSPDAIFFCDTNGVIEQANEQAARVHGVEGPGRLTGRKLTELIAAEDRERAVQRLRSLLLTGVTKAAEFRFLKADGDTYPGEMNAGRLVNAQGRPTAVIAVVRDVTERRLALEKVSYAAMRDTLTGLPNRVLLQDRLSQAMARARRFGRLVVAMVVDIDDFQQFNRVHGHEAGDLLLQHAARVILERVRECDTAVRMGADEFVVVLSDLASPADAQLVARRLLEAIAQPASLPGGTVSTTASIGMAVYPSDADDMESLLKNADSALASAKAAGKNTYHFFSPALTAQMSERAVLAAGLGAAVERGELFLNYQPMVDVGTGKLIAVEALVRWRHPDLGDLMPLRFLPVAEETGLIVPVGRWVLEEACQRTRAWRAAGGAPVPMAVNLSQRELDDPGLVETIDETLRRNGLSGADLEIEVTEGALMSDMTRSARVLGALRDLGVTLMVDDFGLGYSSFGKLRQLPIDGVKIDRLFMQHVAEDADNAAIVIAMIAMAHNLQLRVTAEGVETPAQRAALQTLRWGSSIALNCERVQGFLFGAPVDADSFAQSYLKGR